MKNHENHTCVQCKQCQRAERLLQSAEGFIDFAIRCRRYGMDVAKYYASEANRYCGMALSAHSPRSVRQVINGKIQL